MPASTFPLCRNLILPSQTHPAAFSCCQIPLSLSVLFYSNIFPPHFNLMSDVFRVLPWKIKARQGVKLLCRITDALKGRNIDASKMRPNPCISCLYTLRHFFFYFKFKSIYIYNRESPIAVCIYINRIWRFTRLSVRCVLMPFPCTHFYMDTLEPPCGLSVSECDIIGIGQFVFILILP